MSRMRRRRFLATLPAPLLAAPRSPAGFGFSLYGLRGVPVTDAIGLCADLGYRAVELCALPGWSAEPKSLDTAARKRIVAALRKRKMAMPAIMDNLSLTVNDTQHAANLKRLDEVASLAHDLAVKTPPLIETVIGGRPADWEKLREPMAARLRDWEPVARKAGIVVAIKPHVGGAVNAPDRALWLLRQVPSPWIKAVYDFSHYSLIDLELAATMKDLIAETRFVHIKDAAGKPPKYEFLLPGDGATDYREYARLLRSHRYTGWVVVEVSRGLQDKPGYDGPAAARRCFEKLGRIFGG